MEDDLLVSDPGDASVFRNVSLPAHSLVTELGKRPPPQVVVGTGAFEPDLVTVLASGEVHSRPVDRRDDRDTPRFMTAASLFGVGPRVLTVVGLLRGSTWGTPRPRLS
jgi:hypothetical protein